MSGTTYNKTSCRACGSAFLAARVCENCGEPVKWICGECGRVDDSTHVHIERTARVSESC